MAVQTEVQGPTLPLEVPPGPGLSDGPATPSSGAVWLRPGWPLLLLFGGYPLWWFLGLTDVVPFVATAAMAYELLRMRAVRVPPGFGLWLLFLVWVTLGGALVQVDVPGAVAGSSATRYLTWAWRLLWFIKATVLLLYLGNMRRHLSLTWICRVFSWMFLTIVAGGLLGVLAPRFQLHSLTETLLPNSLTSSTFVYSKVHPVATEAFALLGGGGGRTSAPFAYSNVWGLNFACFLPFFIVAWLGRDAGWRRFVAPFVLAAATVPVVYSLNRGLWVALVGAAIFVAVRYAIAGRLQPLIALVVGSLIVGGVLALSPLGAKVDNRIFGSGPSSNQGRTDLSLLGFRSTVSTSPILGFGTTRNVQGNFSSIAGGSTSSCPRCSLPALGTQGQIWEITFTVGLGGGLLYFGFLVLQFLRHIRMRSGFALAGLAILLMHFLTSAVYAADSTAILAIFAAIALLWRVRVPETSGVEPTAPGVTHEQTLGDYAEVFLRHRTATVALIITGILGGVVLTAVEGTPYAATVSVFVPPDPHYPAQNTLPATLDTIARSATSDPALEAMKRAAGSGHRVESSALSVTARPNSRILRLTYVGRSAGTAQRVVAAAAQSLLSERRAQLTDNQRQRVATLREQLTALGSALQTADQAAAILHSRSSGPLARGLVIRIREVSDELAQVTQVQPDAGTVTTPVTERTGRDGLKVNVASGVALAVLLCIALAYARRSAEPGRRPSKHATVPAGVRVLAQGTRDALDPNMIITLEDPVACVGLGTRRHALATAVDLDSRIAVAARRRVPGRVILVGAGGEPARNVDRARRRLEKAGLEVAGLVIVDRSPGH